MSTLKTANITHEGNTGTANIVLSNAGNVTVGADLIATKQNGCQRIILEQFFTPCDGSVITLQDGNHTITNCSSAQTLTASEVTATGSEITYTPPTGTTQVIYEYAYTWDHHDADPIVNTWLKIDGTAVTWSANTQRVHQYGNGRVSLKWAINIGGDADTDSGRQASWTSDKTLLVSARAYSDSYQGGLHTAENFGPLSNDVISKPCLGITAIG